MKKKSKKKEMPEFSFKQFTPDEDRIYTEAVNAFRKSIDEGKKLKEAYDSHPIADEELRSLIQADFLKILIAERHFAKRESLDALAQALGISIELITDARKRMLQEVGISAASQFGKEHGSMDPDAPATND